MIAKKMRLPGADDGKVVEPQKKTPDQPQPGADVSDATLQEYLKGQKDERMIALLKVLQDLKAGDQKNTVPVGSVAPILKEQSDRAQMMAASSPNAQFRPGLEPGGLFDAMAKFAGGMEFGEGGTPRLERGSRENTKVNLDDLGGGPDAALDLTRREAEQARSLQPGNGSQYDDDIKFLVDSVMGRGSDAGKKDPLEGYREPAPGNIESNTIRAETQKIKPPLSNEAESKTKKGASAKPKSSYGPPDINLEDIVNSILGGVPNPFGVLSSAMGRSPGGTGSKASKPRTGPNLNEKVDINRKPSEKGLGPGYKDGGIPGAAFGYAMGEQMGQTPYTGIPRTTDTSQGGLSGSNIAGLGYDRFWDYRGGVPQRGQQGELDPGALAELANKYGVDQDRIVQHKGGGKGGFRGIGTIGGGGGGGGMMSIAAKAMKAGGVAGGELIQVGERSPKDKNYETSEVVLAAPGTVVAPIPKGMGTPSREDAMGLIVHQLMKHMAGEDAPAPKKKTPKRAAQGTVTSPNDPYKLLDLLNNYANTRSGYDLGRRGINRDLYLGDQRNTTDQRGQDIERMLGLGRFAVDREKIGSDEYITRAKIASEEREGAAERALKGQLGNRGLDINASKNNNDFVLGKADQAFQRLMAGMRGGALSGVRAGRAPVIGALG